MRRCQKIGPYHVMCECIVMRNLRSRRAPYRYIAIVCTILMLGLSCSIIGMLYRRVTESRNLNTASPSYKRRDVTRWTGPWLLRTAIRIQDRRFVSMPQTGPFTPACTPRKAPSTLAFATQGPCAMTYQSFDQEYSPSPISYSISGVHIE